MGRLRQPTEAGAQYFRTTRIELDMAERLRGHDVRFAGEIESTFLRDLLSWIVPILILIGFWVFMIRRFAEKQGFGGSCRSASRRPRSMSRPTPR